MTEQKKSLAPRIHPDERSRIEALNSMDRLRGANEDKIPLSYYTPFLIQVTLPHSDPKVRDWKKTNGDFTLIVSSGVDSNLKPYGIPYGSFPRLVLAYIITRVIATGDRRIELASHFGSFLKEIGYTGNLRGNTRASRTIQSHFKRLFNARLTVDIEVGDENRGRHTVNNIEIAAKSVLWWDYNNEDQDSLWGSHIELSEQFQKAILTNPVPLRTDILAALHKSTLAVDVYMWVSYRLFAMQNTGQESITLSYGRLQEEQFGTGISEANYRSFRRDFKTALAKVAQYWQAPGGDKQLLNYELHEDSLTLFRSPLLVPVPRRKVLEKDTTAETHRVLKDRMFDAITLKKARLVADGWDVRWLSNQYFEWISKEDIVPIDPRAHFVAFVRKHVERNGKPS